MIDMTCTNISHPEHWLANTRLPRSGDELFSRGRPKKNSTQKKLTTKKNSSPSQHPMSFRIASSTDINPITHSRLVAIRKENALQRRETVRLDETANKDEIQNQNWSIARYGTMQISDVDELDKKDELPTSGFAIDTTDDEYHTPNVKKNAGKKSNYAWRAQSRFAPMGATDRYKNEHRAVLLENGFDEAVETLDETAKHWENKRDAQVAQEIESDIDDYMTNEITRPRLVKGSWGGKDKMDEEVAQEMESDIDDYMMNQVIAVKKHAGAGKANLPKVSTDRELEAALDWEYDDLPALETPVAVATNTSTTRSQGQGPKVTRWTATYNNPTYNTIREFAENMISSGKIKGFVGQEEVGANGTPHYQFYTEFKAQTHMTGVKKAAGVNSLHLEKSKGSKKQNIAYCTKEDTRAEGTEPFLWGTCADERAGQGARNDIDAFARAVVEHGGVNMNVMEEFPGHALRYGRHGNDLMAARHRVEQEEAERAFWVEEARRQEAGEEMRGQQQRHVELYFGPTAVGKTSAIKTKVIGVEGKHLYNKAGGNRWYCGYNGQEAVLIDEFKGDSYGPVEEFNNVTNMGTTNVETKGGHAMLTATDIYVASNRHPSHWWKKGQDTYLDWTDGRYRAVARRFAKVTWWNDAKEKVVLVNPGPQENTEEWTERNTQWVAFWEWKTRLAVAGDTFTSDDNLYFTL
uniref:Replication-associated protein n=1 Tax=Red panda feces-associated circular DNA virus 18 TaxID=2863971 RepID=A0A8K1HHF3_9VIRU|nr:replication-associated protein [Red panda feces-associated circular DNA virus 18]